MSDRPARRLGLGEGVARTTAQAANLPREIPDEGMSIGDQVHPRLRRRDLAFLGSFPEMTRAVRSNEAPISRRISN